jgi:hypothetical protein
MPHVIETHLALDPLQADVREVDGVEAVERDPHGPLGKAVDEAPDHAIERRHDERTPCGPSVRSLPKASEIVCRTRQPNVACRVRRDWREAPDRVMLADGCAAGSYEALCSARATVREEGVGQNLVGKASCDRHGRLLGWVPIEILAGGGHRVRKDS